MLTINDGSPKEQVGLDLFTLIQKKIEDFPKTSSHGKRTMMIFSPLYLVSTRCTPLSCDDKKQS